MIEQGRGGRLLAASSVAGETGEPFVTLYGSTKWAIRGLVTSVGKNTLCSVPRLLIIPQQRRLEDMVLRLTHMRQAS